MDILKYCKREEADPQYMWDLSALYKTEEEFEKAVKTVDLMADDFKKNYENKLKSADIIKNAMEDYRDIVANIDRIAHYASLDVEADGHNEKSQKRAMATFTKIADIENKMSFFETELVQVDEQTLEEVKNDANNTRYIDDLLKKKEHILSKEVENAISKFSQTFSSFYEIYNTTKIHDITFPDFEVNGKKYEMTYNLFEGVYDNDPDTNLRRKSYEVFYNELAKYKNTTAMIYLSHCQAEKAESELRGYDSVIDFLLDRQNISRELYDRQLDVIMQELPKHMRKYAQIIKKEYDLDKVTFMDLKLDVENSFSKNISVEDARNLLKDGLSILGEDYSKMLDRAFDEKWIDFVNTFGKSTGAFCASPFLAHPYVLISWTGKLTEAIVLSHELGHAGQSYISQKTQNVLDNDPSMYFVESPSTTNELIMSRYLLEKATTDQERRYLSGQIISRTYFHNFVTHFIEGYYQREVYKLIDKKEGFTADDLSRIFKETLQKFWGEDVEINEGSELTWMRQPHYYMGLYPYTYSAGLTIGTQVSKMIVEEGKPAADRWLKALALGSTEDSVGIAKAAGVDITTDKPLKDTIEYIGKVIDDIEKYDK